MFKTRIIFFFVFIGAFAVAQRNDTSLAVFRQAEQELKGIIPSAFYSHVDAEKVEGNKRLLAVWERIISNPKILEFPFESLKKDIAILSPKDKKFMLVTWNIPRNDGTHAYFGYLLVNNSKRIKKGLFKYETVQSYEFFRLMDKSAQIKSPETHIGSTDKWFGMLYTALVECDGFYTLIGWDGNDKLTTRKFVDVLYFKSNGMPVFGKDVFKFPRKNPKRLMFECSSDAVMSLRYNEKKNQIIYSHLSPHKEGILEGQFQYYGPDGTYDALELQHDKWITIEDVDARGEKNKNDKAEKPDPDKQKPVYKPK